MSEQQNSSQVQDNSDPDVEWCDELNPSDINDILGFDLSAESGEDRSGLNALINSALVSYRRLPMLDVIFDRTARQMTTSLRHLTNDNVEVALDDISSTRFGDFLQSVSTPSIIGVLKAEGLDNYCLLAVDQALVYSIVDVLLGGRRGANVVAREDRGFTQIELGLIERVINLMAADFTQAFKPVANVAFTLDRIETTPRFAAIAQDASVCALAKFRIEIEERGGRAVILTPHAALEPVQKKLQREFINESTDREAAWRRDLSDQLAAARLDLQAVLAEKQITIRELHDLQIGQTITFPARAAPLAEIRVGDMKVATGHVGRSGELIAIRLASAVDELGAEEEAA